MFNNIKELNKNSNYFSNIPIIAKNYEEDQKILKYCNDNKDSSKCKCIFPDNDINNIELNAFNPYYCWYLPCNSDDVYITSTINNNKKYCNSISCIVEAKDIYLDKNGKIIINNNCKSSISTSNIISQELVQTSLNKNYVLPQIFFNTYLPMILGLVIILL